MLFLRKRKKGPPRGFYLEDESTAIERFREILKRTEETKEENVRLKAENLELKTRRCRYLGFCSGRGMDGGPEKNIVFWAMGDLLKINRKDDD